MKKFTLLFISGLLSVLSFGQEKKDLTFSFSTGGLNSPYYHDSKGREYYSVDFDYHLSKRHILSSNFNAGKHWYNDKISSILPNQENVWNTEASYRNFSILYKYKFLNKAGVSANIGAGAGIMTQIRHHKWDANYEDGGYTVWNSLTFPVRIDLDYKLTKKLRAGVIGGMYTRHDFRIITYYAGPRLGYAF